MAEVGSARDHVGDVFPRELGELVAAAGLAAQQQSEDECAVLLEEEHVTRLLLVDVPAEHSARGLIVARLVRGWRWGGRDAQPAPGGGLLHEPRDVVVEEGERLFGLAPERLGPGAAGLARRHEPLHDEAVRGLDEQDVLHPALVEEGTDRAEDLLEILARAALVDPHAQESSSGTSGLVQRPVTGGAARADAETAVAGSVPSAPVASKAR